MGMRLVFSKTKAKRDFSIYDLRHLEVGKTYACECGNSISCHRVDWVITDRIFLTPADLYTDLGRALRREASKCPELYMPIQTIIYKARLGACKEGCSYAYFLRTVDDGWRSVLSIFDSKLILEND